MTWITKIWHGTNDRQKLIAGLAFSAAYVLVLFLLLPIKWGEQ